MWIIPNNISHYVQDTEGLISDYEELSQNLEQSAMWRSKPSQASTWHKRLKKGGWIQHLSGRTLRPSHSNSFTEKWTSSLEDSHVNPSLMQGKKQEQTTKDTSGLTSNRAYEIWGSLPLFSLRTSKESSQPRSEIKVFSTMSSSDWSKWVTKRRQEYSVRVKSVEAINESECLLWVCSTESKSPVLAKNVYWPIPPKEESNSTFGNPPDPWATPTTRDYKGAYSLENQKKKPRNLLPDQVKKWSTPIARDSMEIKLTKAPPPRKNGKERLDTMPRQLHAEEAYRGKLNPRWVELLMGVPIGWTSPSCTHHVIIEWTKSECLETESSQTHVQEPSDSSLKNWPTVRAVESEGNVETWQKTRKKKKNCGPTLSVAVKMWSTPIVQDHKRRGPNSKQQGLPNEI